MLLGWLLDIHMQLFTVSSSNQLLHQITHCYSTLSRFQSFQVQFQLYVITYHTRLKHGHIQFTLPSVEMAIRKGTKCHCH